MSRKEPGKRGKGVKLWGEITMKKFSQQTKKVGKIQPGKVSIGHGAIARSARGSYPQLNHHTATKGSDNHSL